MENPYRFPTVIAHPFISITPGTVIAKAGYAWDGASGPAIDTTNFMRASLIHDIMYQAIHNRFENNEILRKVADKTMYYYCRKDGMSWIRAQWCYWAVRLFGRFAIKPNEVLTAP